MVFHVDGNSFYAACERVFRPDLYKSPIAVLTNNDGIIIALNAECKALGFKRGDVFYQVKHKLEKCGVAVFSSNYTLYADMSARMNLIYNRFAADVEIYSIDESFLFFPMWNNADYTALGLELKNTVTRETGIPVSVGIAPNKTLAKMCNKLAKKQGGICDWNKLNQNEELSNCPVGDVWGIGQAKADFLKRHGITTALGLKNYPPDKAKKHLTITGFKTVQELNGIRAIDKIEEAPRQLVSVSRSFQKPVYEIDDIITALAEYTQEAVQRIRAEGLSCRYVSVYLMTNPHAEGEQYSNQLTAELPCLSAFLPEIQATANDLLRRIFRPNYKYRKVMIALTGLDFDKNYQLDLFNTNYNKGKELEPLMQAFDAINNRYGRGTVKLACGLIGKRSQDTEAAGLPFEMRRNFLSPRYTTNINEIPAAY
ncbi:MAG: Y-family DNA polymerase [Treponema sp.]|jgi:DNA polymerase V|nr:Y-family DNA polymerase [Treponema sp.]